MGCSREVRPPVTKHAPSMWGDTFSNSVIDEQEQKKYAEAIEALKQEARGMLMAAATPLKQMILIDTLERLGLAHHFEIEIDHKLQQINDIFFAQRHHDLFTTALAFRLLRQHCHHISSDVFDKFVNKDGKFEVGRGDPEGLLSLYEAAHVRFPGEKILQEAAIFTRHHLIEMGAELESPLKEKVKRALERPLHRDIPIVYARIFISIYEKDPSRNELLLKLAKFNFNFLQNLYRDELSQLSRWWSKLDLKSKLPYTRDRVVEAYIWGVGFHYEPHYSFARMGLVKAFKITGIVDDTYDNYATLNEAQLFTEILDKWIAKEVDRLPDYMKIVYHFVLTIVEDYERNAVKLGKGFAAPYFKEMVQQLARAYNKELNWVMEKQLPSFEEYLKNSEITSCIYILFSSIIMGLKSTTEETIDWIKSEPKLAISTGMLGRYWDDIGSHQRESKGGEMLTALDCYMKQHGTSKEETVSKFAERVEEAWEDVNQEWITATSFMPKETAVLFLNYARNCDATYNKSNGDGYTDPKLSAEIVAALFLHPILNI